MQRRDDEKFIETIKQKLLDYMKPGKRYSRRELVDYVKREFSSKLRGYNDVQVETLVLKALVRSKIGTTAEEGKEGLIFYFIKEK